MHEYFVKPIGVVRSKYREASLTVQDHDLKLNRETLIRTKTGKGGLSDLIIKKEFEDCLDGIEDFSHNSRAFRKKRECTNGKEPRRPRWKPNNRHKISPSVV